MPDDTPTMVSDAQAIQDDDLDVRHEEAAHHVALLRRRLDETIAWLEALGAEKSRRLVLRAGARFLPSGRSTNSSRA
jgi:hypothetical protein